MLVSRRRARSEIGRASCRVISIDYTGTKTKNFIKTVVQRTEIVQGCAENPSPAPFWPLNRAISIIIIFGMFPDLVKLVVQSKTHIPSHIRHQLDELDARFSSESEIRDRKSVV